jgi:hypothetical protein
MMLGYVVADQIFVLINTDTLSAKTGEFSLKDNSAWKMIADINNVNMESGIQNNEFFELTGGRAYDLQLEPASLYIWVKK